MTDTRVPTFSEFQRLAICDAVERWWAGAEPVA